MPRDNPPPLPRPKRRSHFAAVLCAIVIANVVMLGAGWAVLVTMTSHALVNDYPAHRACARTLPNDYRAGPWRFDGPNTIRSAFTWIGSGSPPAEFGASPELRCTFRLVGSDSENEAERVEITETEVLR